MNKKVRIVLAFLGVSFGLGTLPTQAESVYDKWNGVVFWADRVAYQADRPDVTEKSSVYYSKVGTRVEVGEGAAKAISIVNFQKQKCWFVQPGNETYYEVDFDPTAGRCAALDVPGFRPEARNPGIFHPRPCFGFKQMKAIGKDPVRNRRASKWACSNDEKSDTTWQWFDPNVRMVVREASNGRVVEATRIELVRNLDPDLLLPPPKLRLQKLATAR